MTAEKKVGRRGLIAAGALVSATALAAPALAQSAPATPAGATPAGWTDGLAHPIPYAPPPGAGKERGLVLGGGGAYLVSWMMGYFHALKQNGVDLATADVVVGTSAGSVVGAVLSSGRLWRLTGELDFFRDFPKLFAELVPALQANPSQERARKLAVYAKDASFETIRDIGRAAMAARNAAGTDKYFAPLHRLIGPAAWPSTALHTTANDCYTGERIVVSASAGLPVDVACAASSSMPGSMGPTWLKDRLCMDGGICQTTTHSDVVAGVKRALVISLSDGGPRPWHRGCAPRACPTRCTRRFATSKPAARAPCSPSRAWRRESDMSTTSWIPSGSARC